MLRTALVIQNLQNDQNNREESRMRMTKNTHRKSNSVNREGAKDIITQVPQIKQKNFPIYTPSRVSAFTPTNRTTHFTSKLLPPKSKKYLNKKTLVLDLDETLVHSSFTPFDHSDIVLQVDFEEDIYNIHVLVRPYVDKFIEEVSKLFAVVIFTASISKYASPLLDILDKDKKCSYRLFREHCTFINGIYVKDLKRLNRDLKNVIIVDNSPNSYSFNRENGLPIMSWFNDSKDTELLKILPILNYLSGVSDVRDVIPSLINEDGIDYEKGKKLIGNSNEGCLPRKKTKRKNLFCINNREKIDATTINNTNSNLLQKTFSHLSPITPQISNREIKQKMNIMKLSSSINNIVPIKLKDNLNNESTQTNRKYINALDSKEIGSFLSSTASNFKPFHNRNAPSLKISTSMTNRNNPLSNSVQASKTNYNIMTRSRSTGGFVNFVPISVPHKNSFKKVVKGPNNININSNVILLYKNIANSTRHKNSNSCLSNNKNVMNLKNGKIY